MKTWLAFTDLKEGERFSFVYGVGVTLSGEVKTGHEVYTKGRSGWFSDDQGKKYRTGRYAAVKRVQ